MIDPLLSLAFGIQSNKGVYALLLGSGVSRAAQIPTGWEIVLDLIDKLAHMLGEQPDPDPVQWYRVKFGEEPDYSKLLDAVAKSREERQQLLATYFEPTAEEREEGLKLPTDAHRAIATLVARGYVRVIVTTNFDRLIERAIEDAGVTPAVISTPDAVEGALPLVHQRCCVIKVHGDYLDTRIKNTPVELASYDDRVNHLLDRIFDEFGCVVCGWSAQWDDALCTAIERCRNRRFTTYWAVRGTVGDRADRLVKARAGMRIPIKDADIFFTELSEKVISLEEMQQPHPLSVTAAAATVKRLLANDAHLIRLHDLVQEETERAFASLQPVFGALVSNGNAKEKVQKTLSEFRARMEVLRVIGMYGAFWGKSQHKHLFPAIIQRLATDPAAGESGVHLKESVRAIPSIIMLYTMGLAACASNNLEMLVSLLVNPILERLGKVQPYLMAVDWEEVQQWFKLLPEHERNHFPASEWLFAECREILRPAIPDDQAYDRLFDRFEAIRSLVYLDFEYKGRFPENADRMWLLPGRFIYRWGGRLMYDEDVPLDKLKTDVHLAKLLTSRGLFGGDPAFFGVAVDRFRDCVASMAIRYR